MQYKLSSTGEARTSDYMGTVTNLHDSDPVSYTHLTLPTNREV